MNKEHKKVLLDPLFNNNPIALQVLGIFSALAVTTKMETAVVMSLALTAVLCGSNLTVSLLRNRIPPSVRIIFQLSVIASLVMITDQVLKAYLFDISRAFRLKPSVMVDYSRASTSFKASLNAGLFDSRVFIGGAYDHPNYAIALLNLQVNPQWLVGYAYTIGIGPVRTALGGSHEVVVRWELRPVIHTIPEDPFYF